MYCHNENSVGLLFAMRYSIVQLYKRCSAAVDAPIFIEFLPVYFAQNTPKHEIENVLF